MLRVSQVFVSMQGEGIDTGLPTLFVRFTGCNMGCTFCDEPKSLKGKDYHHFELLGEIADKCKAEGIKNIVFTGGEPLIQPHDDLRKMFVVLKALGYKLGLETNGTIALGELKAFFDVISLSPKLHRDRIELSSCTNLKILYPYVLDRGSLVKPEQFNDLAAKRRIIQPIYGEVTYKEAFEEVKRLGNGWVLGVQLHKLLSME